MRERAAQKLNPKMGRMGAEDPSRVFRPGLYPSQTIVEVASKPLLVVS